MGEQLKSSKAFFPNRVEQGHITGFFYFGLGIGIMRLTVHEMVRLRVVLGVRVLPRVVRDQQHTVEYESDTIIDKLRGGEPTMTSFVRQDPPAG